jgi:hypothetical protein
MAGGIAMKVSVSVVLIALAVVTFLGCGRDDEDPVGDHVWDVEFWVNNTSDLDLEVGLAGPAFRGHTETSAAIPANSEALVPMTETIFWRPVLEECVWCVSVRQENGGHILRQICPPTNGDWDTEETGDHALRFTLRLAPADLAVDAPACPALFGHVMDGLSGDGIAGANVRLEAGEGAAVLTDETGDYTIHLRADLPQGHLYISKDGYLGAIAEVMDDLIVGAESQFVLETTLQRGER